jgi:hypothetical protein
MHGNTGHEAAAGFEYRRAVVLRCGFNAWHRQPDSSDLLEVPSHARQINSQRAILDSSP